MGIIFRQGLKNTIFIYLGFIIGGIYTVLLIPKVFNVNPEHWGTARYLVSYAMIIVPWAQMSIPNVIIRFFPIFKEKRKKDFMFFILFWTSVGIFISVSIILIFSDLWFDSNTDILLSKNKYYVLPIFIGFVLMEIASAVSKSLFKTTVPVFLKEFFLRSLVMIIIVLYWYEIIDFDLFIKLYALNYIVIFIILFVYLLNQKVLKFSINFKLLFDKDFKQLYVYAAFSILSTGAAMILLNIDTLMINHYLTLKDVAVYGPSIFIASSILIPSRALISIITPLVSQAWASNDIKTISKIYRKSAIAPLTITIFLFLIIWINIDLVMGYFGETFGKGKYIFLFLGVGHIVNIATGINGTIINTSKYYKADLYFQIVLVVLTILMNIIFIPLIGLDGAALATAITLGSHNLLKSFYVFYRFKIHPFSIKTVYVIIIGLILFFIINNLPQINSLLISSVIYTIIVGVFYWIIAYSLKISEDVNEQIKNFFLMLFKRKK